MQKMQKLPGSTGSMVQEDKTMRIRSAELYELDRIMQIYAYARQFMAEQGNPRQWAQRGWPPEDLIRDDIESGRCYVCVDEENLPHAVFSYEQGSHIEPGYDGITEGGWIGEENYGVVHRIAADGSQRGLGAFCLNWAFSRAGHLRIDTHPDNLPMQGLLRKLGFRYCGIIHVKEDGDPRYAYERLV